MSLKHMLAELKGVKGLARADSAGNVQEVVGQVDAETSCAVGVMCLPHLESAGGLLQLGSLQGFAIVSQSASMVLSRNKGGVKVAVSDTKLAPDAVLRRLAVENGEP